MRAKKVLIWGRGKSGNAAAMHFSDFMMIDKNDENKFDFNQKFELVVLSPGVETKNNSNLDLLISNGAKIIGELELGFTKSKGDFFAITGTNGKTTTITLISEIFKNYFKSVFLCGNVGVPVCEIAFETKKYSKICIEVSSFQLDSIKSFSPKIAGVLNIAPDHLIYHKSFENYIKAKKRIFEFQTKKDYLVLNHEDIIATEFFKECKSKCVFFSSKQKVNGAYLKDDFLFFFDEKIINKDEIKLIGIKNIENVLAATCFAKLMKIPNKIIEDTIKNFQPLKHRLQFVKNVNGVSFINDSKATNVDSAINALNVVPGNKIVLLGGSSKDESFSLLARAIKKNDTAIIFGATKNEIIKEFKKHKKNYFEEENFSQAFDKAVKISKIGDTVLLSPACASFDEFDSYEQRGEVFIEKVARLQ